MKNRIVIIFLVIFFGTHVVKSQKLLYSSTEEAQIAGVDKFGNIYLIKNSCLVKLSKTGNQLNSYSDKNRGNILFADINNPLRLVVLHKNTQQVVILDNTLSIIGNAFNMSDFGIADPTLVLQSDEGGFWVFDSAQGVLSMITFKGQAIRNTQDIKRFAGQNFNPQKIGVFDAKIYIIDESQGIVIMDKSGNFVKFLDIKHLPCCINIFGVFFAEQDEITYLETRTYEKFKLFSNPSSEQILNFDYKNPYLLVQLKKNFSLFLTTD